MKVVIVQGKTHEVVRDLARKDPGWQQRDGLDLRFLIAWKSFPTRQQPAESISIITYITVPNLTCLYYVRNLQRRLLGDRICLFRPHLVVNVYIVRRVIAYFGWTEYVHCENNYN